MANIFKPLPQPKADGPPSFEESQNAAPVIFKTYFACVTLNMSDRIRFINFPTADVETLLPVISSTWTRGIQVFIIRTGDWPDRENLVGRRYL